MLARLYSRASLTPYSDANSGIDAPGRSFWSIAMFYLSDSLTGVIYYIKLVQINRVMGQKLCPDRKMTQAQRLYAFDLYRRGFGPTAIHNAVFEQYDESDEPASLRTIKTWVKAFKQLGDEAGTADSPFQWHRLEDYGLPWEAGA